MLTTEQDEPTSFTTSTDPAWAPRPADAVSYQAPAPAAPASALSAANKPTSLLVVAALAVGGFFVYKNFINPKCSAKAACVAPAPNPTPVPRPAPNPTPNPNPVPRPAPNPTPNAALLTHVPDAVRGSCEPYQIQGTDVAVVCSTDDSAGQLRVVYAQYTPALVDSTFMQMTQGLEIIPSSQCGSGTCDYSSNSTNDTGRDAWYQATSSSGSPVMGVAWTSDNTGIFAFAEQQASNNSALEAWWASSSSGPM